MTRPQATPRAIAVARGDEPADLLITGGRVFVPTTREWVDTDLAIGDGVVVGLGRARRARGRRRRRRRAHGRVRRRPHAPRVDEAVGRRVRAQRAARTAPPPWPPTRTRSPTCSASPASPRWSRPPRRCRSRSACARRAACPRRRSRARAPSSTPADVRALLEEHGAIGVAEVMNFPGVIAGDPEMLARDRRRRPPPGRRPRARASRGRALDAYLAAGVESDHECTALEEAEEKRRKGMWVFIRQGSASQNLAALIPMVLAHGTDARGALHRRPRARHAAEPRPRQRLRAPRGRSTACREVDALVLATHEPGPRTTTSTTSGSSGPGYQADVLAFDALDDVAAGARVAARPARGRATARSSPGAVPAAPRPRAGCAATRAPRHAAGRRGADLAPPPGGHARAGHRRSRAGSSPTATSCSTSAIPASTSPASPCSSATTRPAASGSAGSRASACAAARSPRPSRTTRTTAWSSARARTARATWRSRSRGSPRSAAVRSPCSTAACSPRCRCRSAA